MSRMTLHEIYRAQQRIAPYIVATPLQRSMLLSTQLGFDVWLKQENRQHTGSFKPRGALNKFFSLSDEERARGIVAASAGNHALGVAYAAQRLNLPKVDVFVQANAAPAKIAKLRHYPINLHLVGQLFDEAQAAAFEFVEKSGGTFVSAYDDVDVIAGQATIGLEIMSALPDVETIVVPTGGGGLIAGIAVVAKSINPAVRVIGVNPEASPSGWLSKRDGFPYETYDNAPTLAHGLAGGFGRVPFMIGMMLIDEIVLVSEDEMSRSIAALIDSDQVLLEASGVAGIAAVLAGKVKVNGQCVAVLTGGNIDAGTLRSALGVNESSTNSRMNRDATSITPIDSSSGPEANQRATRAPIARVTSCAPPSKPGRVQTPNDALTYNINGLAMAVHNELGPGHREAAYHNALAAKLSESGLAFLDEPEIWVELNDGTSVQKYVPDFIVEETIIIELKAQTWPMPNDDMAQVLDYFAGTDCPEALFYNFGRPRLDFHRLFRPPHIAPRPWHA